MNQVKKLIIPIAGWGTRFLPLTKIIYKEIIPILNRPLIDVLVNQALEANIKEIIFILSPRKKKLLEYFKPDHQLETTLIAQKKFEILKMIQKTNQINQIKVVYQKKQLGLPHALSLASDLIGDEPFLVVLGDDLVTAKFSLLQAMMDRFNEMNSSIVCTQTVDRSKISHYGIVTTEKNDCSDLTTINKIIEKPKLSQTTSNQAIIGHYLFTNKLMQLLKNYDFSKPVTSEISLPFFIEQLMQSEKVYAYQPKSINWYDLGLIEGFVKATVDSALEDPKIKDKLLKHLKTKIQSYN